MSLTLTPSKINFEDFYSDPRFKDLKDNPYFDSFFNISSKNLDKIDNEIINNSNFSYNSEENITIKEDESLLTDTPIPTNLRVSTMTAICSINFNLNLSIFFDNIKVPIDETSSYPYILSCQYGNDNIKGFIPFKKKKKRCKIKDKKRNYFQNQITLIIKLNINRKINLKIFRNGKIQMTGLKSKENGILACNTILKEIQRIKLINSNLITDNSAVLANNPICNFSIVLINSDFYGGFKIKRDKLYKILFRNKYFVSYEPDIYPGVNAKFYWNKKTIDTKNKGICVCKKTCDGKGNGNGDGECKKITIATFQSGNIIITGARNNTQTRDAYNFINKIFKDNYNEIVRISSDDNESETNKNIYKISINIDNIINVELRNKLINKIEF